MIALAGPVRHVLMPPTRALAAEPMPQAMVMALIGGSKPADFSTAMPWLFWIAASRTADP
jgi:hypothetical protein